MIEQLKVYYGSAFTDVYQSGKEYSWFQTKEGEMFGILTASLSEKELNLLCSLFPNERKESSGQTAVEAKWHRYLYGTDEEPPALQEDVRFIQFHLKQPLEDDKQEFIEALQSLFANPIVLVWENDRQGVMIEQNDMQYREHLQSVVQAFISDFLIDLSFYVGAVLKNVTQLKHYFAFECDAFKLARKNHKKRVYLHHEMISQLIINNAEPSLLLLPYQQLVTENLDLRKTIQAYVAANMNMSHAAKKLYIHRNSMQYRVEKFLEKTGVDIRNFEEVIAMYLLIELADSLTTKGEF